MSANLNLKIKIVGVGGGGCNMVSHLFNKYIKDYEKRSNIEVISVNTDIQVLDNAVTDKTVAIGEKLTKGLGAGMKPEVGKESALENYDDILESLIGADMVFIASGLGGGTGTGAVNIVAQAAKEVGALTVSIVTKPFKFEGPKKLKYANESIEELKKCSDTLIVIENEKLMSLEKAITFKNAFRKVDEVLANAVQGIISIILESSKNVDVNVDFADVKTILSYSGSAIISIATEKGDNAASKAIEKALDNPLLEKSDITGTRAVLMHFTMHEDTDLSEIYESFDIIYDKANGEADIIFGTSTDKDLPVGEIKVVLVATGFDQLCEDETEVNLNIGNYLEENQKQKFRISAKA